MTVEPGIDRAEWEAEWQSLEPELSNSPAEALPELDDLVARMLAERGYVLDDPVARAGEEREIVVEFLAAREVTHRSQSGDEESPGDIADAVNAYRELYRHLVDS